MLTYRFGLWILFTVLILAHRPVRAEWVAIDERYQSHPLQTAYINLSSIRREGNVVQLSALIDWKAMQGGRSPTRFYSTKLTKQFDCAERQVRTLAATDFDGHMGMGEVIGGSGYSSEGHWVAIEPGTLNQGLWEAACGKR
ncbi:MAG TPA: surface-adhesin E family protein [Nitrospira sp.]|nr:surface-adhesin E family protein [Nitrospira sp.]